MAPTPTLDETQKYLTIVWDDKHKAKSHVTWLRFHCRCERCVPAFSGMMPLDKSKFEDGFRITSHEIKDGSLTFTIDKDIFENHTSTIPLDWLKENCNCDACLSTLMSKSEFNFADPKVTPVPSVHYDTLSTKEGKFQCLEKVFNIGFCVIEGVPRENLMVHKVGEMFGYIRSTLYAKHFDVKYEPNTYNSAYTTLGLPYHQDLPYYEAMPGVQLLHTIEFEDTIKGGDSQLMDLFKAAEVLKEESPEDFETLCRIPCTFQTKDLTRPSPAWYENARTLIEVDYFGNVVSIHWNPGVEGPVRIRPDDQDAYYKAYAHFSRIIDREELEFAFRLKPGDLILFNNRRMAHARKVFDKAEGKRHLQGCYINLDDMKSTYMVLAHQLGKKVDPPRCGNRSWF